MMDLKDKNAVALVNTCEKTARLAQNPYFQIWKDAVESFEGRQIIDDPYTTNISVNHLLSTVETMIPSYVKALLGTRPFIPLRARNDQYDDWAGAIEKVIDEQLDLANFFELFTQAFRMCVATGNSFIEPFWDAYEESYAQFLPVYDQASGQFVAHQSGTSTKVTEALNFRVHGPWDVFVDPWGESLDQKRWIIIKQLTTVEAVRDIMDISGTGYEKYTREQLKKSAPREDEWNKLLSKDRDIVNESDSNVGMLVRFISNDRYVDVWNYDLVLRDVDNPNENLPKYVKPLIHFKHVSEIGPRYFWGKGVWEEIGSLARLGDDVLSEVFDQIMMSRAQWLMYNPQIIDPEDLDAVYGNRVPVPGGRFDQAVKPIELGQPDMRGFQMYDVVRGFIDYTTAISVYQRGGTAPRREAALTTQVLKTAGDEKLEFGVRYFEGTAMTRLGYLVAKTISGNMSQTDIADAIGWEMAQRVPSMDPTAIPGGYDFVFNGSDRVTGDAQKLENFQQWWNLVGNDPQLMDRVTALRQFTKRLRMFTKDEVDRMFPTPAQNPQQQGIQQQMQANALGGGEQGGVQSVGQSTAIQNPRYGATPNTNVEQMKTA